MNAYHNWTDSGKELLRIVENEIAQSGGYANTIQQIQKSQLFKYSCDKPECEFCRLTKQSNVVKALDIVTPVKNKDGKTNWSKMEVSLLKDNINVDYKYLRNILPYRSKWSIFHKMNQTCKRMGLVYRGGFGWVKEGTV